MPLQKLLDQVRERLRVKHYSRRTEDAYLHWVRRFIYFQSKTHPREMGGRDRRTMLPERLIEPLRAHLTRVRVLHQQDLAEGFGDVYLPFALARKYPKAGRSWPWQYVFPAHARSTDLLDGAVRRHHLDEKEVQRAKTDAADHLDTVERGPGLNQG